jgi:hypothetical protein
VARRNPEQLPHDLPNLEDVRLLLFHRQWTDDQVAEFAKELLTALRVLYLVAFPTDSAEHIHAREFLVADLLFLSSAACYLHPLGSRTALGLLGPRQRLHAPETDTLKSSRADGNRVTGWPEYDVLSNYITLQLPTLRRLQGVTRAYLVTIVRQLLQAIDDSDPLRTTHGGQCA